MQTIQFNTGRFCSAEGQRIIATYYPAGEAEKFPLITFHDLDRQVCGQISPCNERTFRPAAIVAAYDRGNYMQTRRADEDAMGCGGANSTWDFFAEQPARLDLFERGF